MQITNCSIEDYHNILEDIALFWGSKRTIDFHHPMFVYEFGNSAFVIKNNKQVIAYLLGFLSQKEKVGYIHLAGVRQEYQNNGLGIKLYNHFTSFAKANSCTKLKAITTASNIPSINFHKKIGMTMLGKMNKDGIKVIKNYSGKGVVRVVFEKNI